MVSPGGAEADVVDTVRRGVPVTVRRADDRRRIDERPAPKETRVLFNNRFRYIYNIIIYSLLCWSGSIRTVLTPFKHVPQHVEQPQVVRQQAPARPGMFLAVGLIPGISVKQVDRVTVISAGDRTCPAGVFPFRLGGQAIARALAERRQGSTSPRRKLLPRWGGSTTGPSANPPARSASCSSAAAMYQVGPIHRSVRDRDCTC